MSWLRRLVRHFLGHTRYHEQAQQVTVRRLRADRLVQMVDSYAQTDDHLRR